MDSTSTSVEPETPAPVSATAPRRLPVVGLSKSRYTAGLQCHRRLWWTVHDPDAPELTVGTELQAVFDQGHRVGEAAQAYFPGGTLIDLAYFRFSERVEATRAAIQAGANVLYEASFLAGDVFVAVDVLHRAHARAGWTVTEVKSTLSVKDEHLLDAAVQAHVVAAAGLVVSRVEVMHLNADCRYPDLSDLFVRTDVTTQVQHAAPRVAPEISAQLATLARETVPEVAPGPHCTEPRPCPFLLRCSAPAPEHALGTLRISAKKRAGLTEEGYRTVLELPDELPLSELADRQRRAVKLGELVVEPGLAAALATLELPLAHLDFETIAAAIPVWPGCSPYTAVPVQFSVRFEERDHSLTEIAWLAAGPEDPRPALAAALVAALRGAGSIIVYSKSFESGRLHALADFVPALAQELRAIAAHLVDLLPIVRAYVYHPAFGGSFSLKSVAPALVPGFSYDDLAIGDGHAASSALSALVLRNEPEDAAAREQLRRTLLSYCGRDTLATAGVLARLRELA